MRPFVVVMRRHARRGKCSANRRKYVSRGRKRDSKERSEGSGKAGGKSGLPSEGQRWQVYFVCHAARKFRSAVSRVLLSSPLDENPFPREFEPPRRSACTRGREEGSEQPNSGLLPSCKRRMRNRGVIRTKGIRASAHLTWKLLAN